jgi:LPS-assembly lipoprotein
MKGVTRRATLAGTGASLAGCGFHPLYAPAANGDLGPAESEMAAVWVPVIPDRTGQVLRQALQQRLEGSDAGVAKKYTLNANFGLYADGLAIRPDTTATYVRLTGSSSWHLTTVGLTPQPVTSGQAQAVDGYNILDQQYFAAVVENDTTIRRLAETLADQIVTRLAIYFRRKAAGKA